MNGTETVGLVIFVVFGLVIWVYSFGQLNETSIFFWVATLVMGGCCIAWWRDYWLGNTPSYFYQLVATIFYWVVPVIVGVCILYRRRKGVRGAGRADKGTCLENRRWF